MATLKQQYNEKQESIRHQLLMLMDKIDNHQEKQKSRDFDWSLLRDLDFVDEKLNVINKFIK
jgi:hypothetical protein